MIDKADNEHNPSRRADLSDALVSELRGIFGTDDRLEEICNAKRDGRCVVLPCNENDTVYRIEPDKTISKWNVLAITKYDGLAWCVRAKNVRNKWRYIDIAIMFLDFGKTVFLTKEEAEKALKGGASK